MKLALLILCLFFVPTVQAQFVPTNCNGSNDTSKFTSIVTLAASNTGTIEVPFINGSRCAVNTMTIPANITIDNTVGTGIRVNAGQVLTVLGPVINPVGKPLFFGPGTVSFAGNPFVGSNGQSLVSNGLGGASWQTITGGGGGGAGVSTFNGRDGAVLPIFGDYTWAQINKASSSLADLTTRSADELSNGTTGTGAVVLRDSPTLVTPTLGVAQATSLNRVVITTPATNATLTIADGKTVVFNNALTVSGTDGKVLTLTGSLSVGADTTISGGGTLALGGFSGTVPASGTFAMGANTLSISTSNNTSSASHTHAISSSSNPGAAAALLSSDVNGHLQLIRLGLGTAPTQPLEVGGNVFINAATANLFMKDTNTGFQSASTLVVTPQANNCFRSTNFTSGLLGFNICATGNAEFNNVDVRGAIHAGIIVFNALQATAGTLGVFHSAAKLRTDVTVPTSPTYGTTQVTIDVVDGDGLAHVAAQLFAVNDILRLKDGLVGDTWFRVASVSDQTTFWRYNATIMAGSANATYRAGLGVADYGASGQGFIIQCADCSNGPYLQMATHSATFTSQDAGGTLNVTPQTRMGNLNGSYGYATDTFGYATGQYGTASKTWLTVEQTNGIRIGNNTTQIAQWDTAGTITVGQVTVGQSNIQISAGQLRLRNNTTDRILLNADGSGFLANSNINWDASGNLSVLGNAVIAGFTITSTSLTSGSGANTVGIDSGGVNPAFYAGSATPGSAPFRVTSAGALTATNATITGAITATSGSFTGSITSTVGTIGGFTIAATSLKAGSGSTTVALDSGGSNPAIYVGSATPGSAPFRVTNAGALTATNATISGGDIAGWTINSTSLTKGEVKIAAGVDVNNIAGVGEAWFGRSATGGPYYGLFLKGTTAALLSITAGQTAIGTAGRPYIQLNDGTRARVVIGELNTTTWDGTATNSMGMKIWDSSGNLLAKFADDENKIANWTIGTNKISSTGIDINSGANASLAFGSTPPTSASSGTGIWLDRTGLYGLASNVVQVKVDATTGALVAGASATSGITTIDQNGITIVIDSSSFQSAGSIKHKTSDGKQLSEFWDEFDTVNLTKRSVWWAKSVTTGGSYDTNIRILAQAPTGSANGGSITLDVSGPTASNAAGSTVSITRDYIALFSLNQKPNIGLNTTTFGTSAVGVIGIGNATTVPTSSPANMVQLYSEGGELKVRDASSNITQISPHEPGTDRWVFYSCNSRTLRCIKVDMEKLVKTVEAISGEKLMQEWNSQQPQP